MYITPTLKRTLLFLIGLMIALSLYSAPVAPSVPLAAVPATTTPLRKKEPHKATFLSFKVIKQAVKNYVRFAKGVKKKYRNDAIGSTILIALLLAGAMGGIVYLLSYLSVSGIVITSAAILGFGLILYWAWRRIRYNAQY
jgi:uncharacterized membrane protein YoaK (UPF0700 family)